MQAKFLTDVLRNSNNAQIIERWDALNLIDGWLVAGCLFQTVWNVLSGHHPESKIKDYDFFYYDPSDLSAAGESAVQRHVEVVLEDLGITVEVANQARVHCWYEEHFGLNRHGFPRHSMTASGSSSLWIEENKSAPFPQRAVVGVLATKLA